jgi:hypothetical protein
MTGNLLFSLVFLPAIFFYACKEDKYEPDVIAPDGSDSSAVVVRPVETDYTRLSLTSKDIHNVQLDTVQLDSDGDIIYSLIVNGNNSYLFSDILYFDVPSERTVLEFYYQADKQIDNLKFYFIKSTAPSKAESMNYGTLYPSEYYRKFTADISELRADGWGLFKDWLRIEPGQYAGVTLNIKDLKIRNMTDAEIADTSDNPSLEESKQRMADNIESYLSNDYSSTVSSVNVSSDQVTITGTCGSSGTYALAEICPWQDVTEMSIFPYSVSIDNGSFTVTMDRIAEDREGIDYDRVFSKWVVLKVEDGLEEIDSHARYADEVAPIESPAALPLKNKKGFGAGDTDLYFSDCEEMNVGSITMNVLLSGIISGEGSDYEYGGVSYNVGSWESYCDGIVSKAHDMGIAVSAIILLPATSNFKDPENTGGYYTMPNLTTASAFNLYAAALTYMASRYCKDDPGRVHNWIMHNEVDMGSIWTNMGEQPMMRYLDRYVKSMRICYNIVRQYDQNASVLGSFTHSWATSNGGDYAPKEMLEKIVAYSKAEGDFKWGIACHPYPESLRKPEFWINDTEATYSMNSSYVTFKNLEVLDTWIKQPENLYNGTTKRALFLSEQGTNSPDYTDNSLKLQAAGGAWAWKKVSQLDGIDAIQWHNWADNTAEAGLKIGLRDYDKVAKPVWYVWKAAGTDDESSVLDPYMSTLGITSWDEIMHEVE